MILMKIIRPTKVTTKFVLVIFVHTVGIEKHKARKTM